VPSPCQIRRRRHRGRRAAARVGYVWRKKAEVGRAAILTPTSHEARESKESHVNLSNLSGLVKCKLFLSSTADPRPCTRPATPSASSTPSEGRFCRPAWVRSTACVTV
jgi:hypothetical protein